ncbi:hypothetical protein AGMMS49949_07570 [Alphaproteobacteria bacterium]|nr:hypothetical protein AGMMS49949_07570 [Alphaproteobacteria bacterium]
MTDFWGDSNFYVGLSLLALLGGGTWKFKKTFTSFLKKRIESISKALNNAACEKDQALLEYTKINSAMAKLPDEIAKVWEESALDFPSLDEKIESELEGLEKGYNARLRRLQEEALRQEYFRLIDALAQQFQQDVQFGPPKKKALFFDRALEALEIEAL